MTSFKFRNIVSVSWGDHLVFGEGDGKLNTVAALRRRMQRWKTELGASIIHWRCTRDRINGRFYAGKGYQHFFKPIKQAVDWDDFAIVPECAHGFGLKVFLYVSLFDEGWPLAPKKVREESYHNKMHCQHVSWQSDFSRKNPQFAVVDRNLQKHQWGVLCLAYPEVRSHLINRYQRLLGAGNFDGLFVCLRSQSKPAEYADQFGFNEPIRQEYLKKYGQDILVDDFDLQKWRDLLGQYLTCFIIELNKAIHDEDVSLAVGITRGNILGPPLGNATLQWDRWARKGIVDQLVIDQNSSKCPSMWHELWSMHRGCGYLQNYLDGFGMKSLQDDLSDTYAQKLDGNPVQLYIARQWHARSPATEQDLLRHSIVQGLVFSSFRHDNPEPIRRNDWTA